MRHRFVRLEDLAAEIGNEYGVGRVRDDGIRGEAAADICAGGPVWPRWSHAEPASLERLNVPVTTPATYSQRGNGAGGCGTGRATAGALVVAGGALTPPCRSGRQIARGTSSSLR